MNIGQTVYSTIVRYAEGGARVTKVVLPKPLYAEWTEESHHINSLFAKLGVEVVEGEVVEPKFHLGERIE